MRTIVALVFALALITGPLFGNGQAARAQDDPIQVTTTIGQLRDLVENIGGDRVDVTGLMGSGVDPHLYSPTARDVDVLGEADLVFYGGLELEGRMIDTLEAMDQGGFPTVPVFEAIPEDELLSSLEDDYTGVYDPHIWFDVTLWMMAAEAVTAELAEHSPDDAEYFQENTDAYLAELEELDQYVRDQLETVPEDQRVLVTAHDAFQYFGNQYDFEVIGLQGLSTEAEASAGDVQDTAEFVAENEIPAIFFESSVPASTVEAVQAASISRGWELEIGGELYSDAMGEEGTEEDTYIGMFTANVDTIVTALTPDEDADS